MRHRPTWAPDVIDIERPAAARRYDHGLGGSHTFAADRAQAGQVMRVRPNPPHITRANRRHPRRAVRPLSGPGVDRFPDLGSGIPAGGNMHDVAHALNPAARTVYADADPIAAAHSRATPDVPGSASVAHADPRDAEAVLADPAATGFPDLDRPVAVLMAAVPHFAADEDDPAMAVAVYPDATVPGSYLAPSHATGEPHPERTGPAEQISTRTSHGMTFRDRAGILAVMADYEPVPPGPVDLVHRRPDADDTRPGPLGGDEARHRLPAAVGRRT